ncbi:GntR family transcriptional regulator [Streptomyces sp. NPDC002787]
MPEKKYARPPRLKAVQLPGPTTSDPERSREELVDHIQDGLAERRYVRGDILPTVAELRDRYGVPEGDVHLAIRELRRAGLLQLHDEYRDTYFLDPGTDRPAGGPPDDLAERVRKLEALYRDLAARVETIEPPPPSSA